MITFIGLSHLGLVTSTSWAEKFGDVFAIDTNKKLVESLKKGAISDPEPQLATLFKKNLKQYHPTNDFSVLKKSKIVLITKDTPLTSDSTSTIDSLIEKIIPHLSRGTIICLMSQIPIGYTRKLSLQIKREIPSSTFKLYYWLNTIVIGSAVERFLNPERIIIGKENRSDTIDPKLSKYLKAFKCPILEMNYESAELTKSAVNLYLASSITVANTISDYCEAAGANIHDVIAAMRLDARIGPKTYLTPNLRISGGHIEREFVKLKHFAKQKNIKVRTVDFLVKLNETRFLWAVEKIMRLVPKTGKITIWGLSYKKNTVSTHNAASIKIIQALSRSFSINAYDPIAKMPPKVKGFKRIKDKYQALKSSCCLLILTEWDEFGKADIKYLRNLMKKKIIVDCVGVLYPRHNELKDFNYISMGV